MHQRKRQSNIMKILNKKSTVYWTPVVLTLEGHESPTWENIGYYEPEPAMKSIISQRNREIRYLKCPAFQKYYENTFVIQCPFDLEIRVDKTNLDSNGKYILTDRYGQQFYDKYIVYRVDEKNDFTMIDVNIPYVFYCENSTIVELMPHHMGIDNHENNFRVIPGEFDIARWHRSLNFSIEIIDDDKPVILTRGEPLFSVRFRPKNGSSVILERSEFTPVLRDSLNSCVTLKNIAAKNTLEENYAAFSKYLETIKNKLFRKRCPFGFTRKK